MKPIIILVSVIATAVLCVTPCCVTDEHPEQIHLTLANAHDFTAYRVTWITLQEVEAPVVQWKTSRASLMMQSNATISTYTAGGWVGTIYSAVMDNLPPGSNVTYRVGTAGKFSSLILTQTPPEEVGVKGRPLRVCQIADMGHGDRSTHTIDRLTEHVDKHEIDVLIWPGDISYANGDQHYWDTFFRKIEHITSRVPILTTPGNHERYHDFVPYISRLGRHMPNGPIDPSSMFYKVRLGPIMLLALNSESPKDEPLIDDAQLSWIRTELEKVNRSDTPWLWAMFHRPMYCSSVLGVNDCLMVAEYFRERLESTFLTEKMDVVFTGHLHLYQRTWPLRYGKVQSKNYTKPTGPVYVINGAAGNPEVQETSYNVPFLAYSTNDFGYGLMEVSTDELYFEFRRSTTGVVLDHFTIKK